MRDDTLKLIAIKQFQRTARHGDSCVAWRKPGRKRVDAAFLLEHVDLRHRHARRDRHLLYHISQAPTQRVLNIRRDKCSAHLPCDGAATGGERGRLEHAGTKYEQRCQQRRTDQDAGVVTCEVADRIAVAGLGEGVQRKADDQGHAGNDHDRREDIGADQASRGLARLVLCREEVHEAA